MQCSCTYPSQSADVLTLVSVRLFVKRELPWVVGDAKLLQKQCDHFLCTRVAADMNDLSRVLGQVKGCNLRVVT